MKQMDITKYVFEAKTINEQKTIVGILASHFEGNDGWNSYYGSLQYIGICRGIGVVQSLQRGYEGRELKTCADCVEMALRGFEPKKEIWEVAEHGYKLVTMEERENNEYPTDCDVRWINPRVKSGVWGKSLTDDRWCGDHSDKAVFAVPLSFEFETADETRINSVREDIRVLADQMDKKADELAELKRNTKGA